MKSLRPWHFVLLSGPLAWGIAAALPSNLVERHYSLGVGLDLAAAIGLVTRMTYPSIFEHVVVALALGLVACATLRWRRIGGGLRALGDLLRSTLLVASGGYALFVLVWGLHYRRLPIAESLGLDTAAPTEAELRALAEESAGLVNAARAATPEGPDGVATLGRGLEDTFNLAWNHLVGARGVFPGDPRFRAGSFSPPKPLLSSVLFSWSGVSGIYFPFTAEPNVNVDGPSFGVPFTAFHELAHQRGIAREDEANFVAWTLARTSTLPDFVYSGAYVGFMYSYNALLSVDPEAAKALRATLHPGVERDIEARKRHRALRSSKVEVVAQAANEAFIRSSGDNRGVRSYDAVLQLMIADRRRR